jgi:uncharacterized protein
VKRTNTKALETPTLVPISYLGYKIVPSCLSICFEQNGGVALKRQIRWNRESKAKTWWPCVGFTRHAENPDVTRQVLASDVRWDVVPGFPYSDVYIGVNAVFDFFTRLFSDFENWHAEPSEFFETGDRVVAIGTYSARAKATGKSFKARFAHVWTVREGVIVRLQQCADTVQISRALEPRKSN